VTSPSLRSAAAFASGLLFAVGLGVAGMTRPSKVIGFLDLFGSWDPSLALVMGGAVAVGLTTFPKILRRASPLFASRFFLPARRVVDARLFFGSALFGVGWGLAGVCPGPALVAALSGAAPILLFVATMVAGIVVADRFLPERQGEGGAATNSPVGAESVVAGTPSPEAPPSPSVETTCG
jgi:uncharacterized membrane protein YedE/YeeE